VSKEAFDDAWVNLKRLIDEAMDDPDKFTVLREGTPSEALAILKQYELDDVHLAALMDGFEKIADRNSARFWSPLAS
jgi:hypothetical protein